MKESKKELIKDVTEQFEKLPENKQQYIIGVMNGILISSEADKAEKEPVE